MIVGVRIAVMAIGGDRFGRILIVGVKIAVLAIDGDRFDCCSSPIAWSSDSLSSRGDICCGFALMLAPMLIKSRNKYREANDAMCLGSAS